MKLTLGQVADWIGAEGDFDTGAEAVGYSIDSRTIGAGELFFAVTGERLDGHDFVATALADGAASTRNIIGGAAVIGGTLIAEPASLPAFWRLAKCLPRALRARRTIMQRRRIDDATLAGWFSFEPVAMAMGEAWVEASPAVHSGPEPMAAVRPSPATTTTL